MAFTIIATVALCYIAVGIYVLLVFDHADERRGFDLGGIATQWHTVLKWPWFIHFIANEDDILIDISDFDPR